MRADVCMQVIFMFGEIDCREGLLLAVDKLKYADIQEAMGVLADIYMEVLTRTVRDRDRDLRIFVHPVPPVLNETRHIVTPFNDLMRQRVRPHSLLQTKNVAKYLLSLASMPAISKL